VGLELGPLSLVSTIKELLERNSNCSDLESREDGRRDPSSWPRGTLYPQKLAVTSPTNGGRSVGIADSGHGISFDSLLFIIMLSYQFWCGCKRSRWNWLVLCLQFCLNSFVALHRTRSVSQYRLQAQQWVLWLYGRVVSPAPWNSQRVETLYWYNRYHISVSGQTAASCKSKIYYRFIYQNTFRIGLLSRNKWFGQTLVSTAHKLISYHSQFTFLTLILVQQKLHSDISQNWTVSLACKSVTS
jgi:hypothetical protein